MASPGQQEVQLHFEGVLEKAGKRFFEGYRKRWFILDGKDLSYYKAPETIRENLLGIIDLARVKSVNPVKMINNGFQITTANRTYHFSAPTAELMTDWVSVLRQAMQLQSFSSRRAKHSYRSSKDEAGYEVVPSRSMRSDSTFSGNSQASFDDDIFGDDLYEPVESIAGQAERVGPTMGTYESVGSMKRNPSLGREQSGVDMGGYGLVGGHEMDAENRPGKTDSPMGTYDAVGSMKGRNAPGHDQVGADIEGYGVVGGSAAPQESEPGMYESVTEVSPSEKVRPPLPDSSQDTEGLYDDIRSSADNFLYSEVGCVMPGEGRVQPASESKNRDYAKPDKPQTSKSLSWISETEDDDSVLDEDDFDIQGIQEDPLPPPVGKKYAVAHIKDLLKEAGKEDEESSENFDIQSSSNGVSEIGGIPTSCESAFTKLKEFLIHLDETDH